jgi:hypothetical protein
MGRQLFQTKYMKASQQLPNQIYESFPTTTKPNMKASKQLANQIWKLPTTTMQPTT